MGAVIVGSVIALLLSLYSIPRRRSLDWLQEAQAVIQYRTDKHTFGFAVRKSLVRHLGDRRFDAYVAHLFSIEEIDLAGRQANDFDLQAISQFPEVKRVKLCAGSVTDEGLDYLRVCQNLEILDFSDNEFTDKGLISLRELPRLRVLSLSLVKGITGRGLRGWKSAVTLEELDCSGSSFNNAGLRELGAFKELRRLNLYSYSRRFNDKNWEVLLKLPHLEEIVLPSNEAEYAAVEVLKKHPHWEKLQRMFADY